MPERRRKLYGCGYEDDSVSSEETSEFVAVWSRLFGMDKFVSIPFPKADEVSLRPGHPLH
jgi:alkyldihydroxyacetonephosphate synthase